MVDALCGFWPHATAEAVAALPGRRVVRLELPPASSGTDPMTPLIELARREPDPRLLIVLPDTVEPDEARATWREHTTGACLHLTTVAPADLVLDGLTDDTPLSAVDRHHGPADDRCIGEVVARQLEQADTVVLAGETSADEWEAEQLRLTLRRIAPWSRHRAVGEPTEMTDGRREPVAPLTRGLRGRAVGDHQPVPDHGVTSCAFRARRPFHPGRLHDALDVVTDDVLRGRGHFWLASRPDLVMTWESGPALRLGPVGGWLDGLPLEHWGTADLERRLAAELDWDPYYGDRHQHLAFTGLDLDADHLHRTLTGCLLTDEELADGEASWPALPDPFARSYPTLPTAGTSRVTDNLRGES